MTSKSTNNCISAIRSITIDAQPNCTSPTIPTSNLVAYYPFNGNANDASSNANNGTVTNASLSADRFCNANSAYDFSGSSNSYIEAPDVAALHMQSFTLSMWVNNRAASGFGSILTKSIGTGNCDSWTVFQHGGASNTPFSAVSCYSPNSNDFAPFLYADRTNNVWTNLIYMVDNVNNIVRFYKDGVLVDSKPWTNTIAYDGRPLQIGVAYEGNQLSFGFDGKIDDIRVYDRALNAAEILALSSETTTTAVITAQTTPAATYCQNDMATPLSVTATGSNLTYQWYSNTNNANTGGTNLGSGAQLATYTPSTTNGGTTYYFCEVTTDGCNSVRSPVSGAIVVNPLLTPSVLIAITTGSNPTCSGAPAVIFTATPTNGGTSPSYQWTKDGTNVGTNSPTYTDAGTTGGVIACVMTVGTAICTNATTATATGITLTVNSGGLITYYRDADADGYGDPSVSTQSCSLPSGFITDNTDCDDTDNLIHTDCIVRISAKVFIQGVYKTSTGSMNDGLRSNGKIPTSQPYNTLTFNGSTAYAGSETVLQSVLDVTGNDAIVDWVLIELRDAANPSNVPANGRRAALLQRDGDIVDVNGTSAVNFPNLVKGNYQVIIRHRLCLATRTNTAVTFPYSSTPSVNFTDNSNALTGSQKLLTTGVYGLYIGDADRSGVIASGDVSSTRSRNPTIPTTFIYNNGYDLDFNASIFSTDVLIVRGNITLNQVDLNQ